MWKKKQARISMEWGMAGFEQDENERTQFEGEDITSPVNGKPMVYYPAQNKWKRSWLVYSVITIFAGIVIAITVGIAYMQNTFNSPGVHHHFEISGRIYNNYVTALILVIIIQVMDRIFDEVAIVLNNVENHRTETQYEDALVGKIFLFKFINSYAYVTFVAFIKPFQTSASCVEDDCYLELSHLLLILTLVPLLIHCIEDAIVRKVGTVDSSVFL